jgi:hypothetical protein
MRQIAGAVEVEGRQKSRDEDAGHEAETVSQGEV